uniref:Uncharacterized protein n=1 Tax=Anopheles merus TaxID=30066 RepID=A0A182VIX1_ANOME
MVTQHRQQQWEEQGSLTIVRRTNSRKNTNIQQQLQYQEALDESEYQQQPPYGNDSYAEGSGGGRGGGGGGGGGGGEGGEGGGAGASSEAEYGQHHPPLSESELAFVNSQLSRELESMQPTSGTVSVVANRTESTTGDELDNVDLATDNLPAVDTPDACDKAAVRLRCLLRQLQRGEISAELLQKNLHYAARVLEAVFIDETNQDGGAGGGGGSGGGGGGGANNTGGGSAGGTGCSGSAAAHGNASSKEPHRGATTSAPPTHGGPTGPPASKGVIQRRRLRAPVWARSIPFHRHKYHPIGYARGLSAPNASTKGYVEPLARRREHTVHRQEKGFSSSSTLTAAMTITSSVSSTTKRRQPGPAFCHEHCRSVAIDLVNFLIRYQYENSANQASMNSVTLY